ncbi:hypothetical protein AVEN_255389-1 [Araneus ventricosus]|uniref:Uncharacterized protein n=1 Tax=Araneus ventricosus TaxID=182803 RepID=A0A4Y2HTF1_ARAVE|nr:hypothetical protein AVEN_255389-1 [Araneus ventricosus]
MVSLVIPDVPELGISLWQLEDTANWDIWRRSCVRYSLSLAFVLQVAFTQLLQDSFAADVVLFCYPGVKRLTRMGYGSHGISNGLFFCLRK